MTDKSPLEGGQIGRSLSEQLERCRAAVAANTQPALGERAAWEADYRSRHGIPAYVNLNSLHKTLTDESLAAWRACAALAQRAGSEAKPSIVEQEPRFWVLITGHGNQFRDTPPDGTFKDKWTKLYTAPVSAAPAQALTDAEIDSTAEESFYSPDAGTMGERVLRFARAILAAANGSAK